MRLPSRTAGLYATRFVWQSVSQDFPRFPVSVQRPSSALIRPRLVRSAGTPMLREHIKRISGFVTRGDQVLRYLAVLRKRL